MIGTVAGKTMVVGVLAAIAQFVKAVANTQKNDSLVQFTSVLRVEPVTMIDKRLERLEGLPDILQTLLSLFSAYYLQAAACMVKVGDVNVMKMLDSINPVRDGALAASSVVDAINGQNAFGMLSMEAYQDRLPYPQDFGLESIAGRALSARGKLMDNELGLKMRQVGGTLDAKVDTSKGIKAATENVNLAVGKLLEVHIESNGSRAIYPISVRLAPAVVDHEVLTHILGNSGFDNSLSERYQRYKANDLGFWRDLVWCQDLIDQQKKLLMKDKTGVMAELNRRRTVNSVAAMSTGTPSLASASAISIISKQTANDLERQNLGKFTDLTFRNKIMQDSLTMLLVVVDPDYESVVIYTRDINLPSKYSIRELKTANKGNGPAIDELLKMYRAGQSPIL